MTNIEMEYLFVDDNLELMEVFKICFSDFLAQKAVYFLRNSTEVLTHLAVSPVKKVVIVLDYHLGSENGLKLTETIRGLYSESKKVTILAYSAILKVEDFQHLEDWGGIDCYIDKSRHNSLELLRDFLEQPEC
jgi:CheY-like chemotaxis protein